MRTGMGKTTTLTDHAASVIAAGAGAGAEREAMQEAPTTTVPTGPMMTILRTVPTRDHSPLITLRTLTPSNLSFNVSFSPHCQ